MSFNPSVKRVPIRRGGRIESDKLLSFTGQVLADIVGLSQAVNVQESTVLEHARASQDSDRDLRQRVNQLAAEIEAMRVANAVENLNLVYSISMYDSRKYQFLADSAYATRVNVDTLFGEATVPINAAEHRFFQQAVDSGDVIPIEDLAVTVTGTFDAGDDQGLIDHEHDGEIDAGVPLKAFNGNNVTRWVRTVSFDLYSDVTEVMCELIVDLPAGSGGESNVVYVIPAPAGDVDIVGVYLSPDLGNSFSLIPGFEEVEGAGPTRWIFPVRQVQRVKIRFRQKNWYERDGKKVFTYGAQEIGLQLLEWDKVYSSSNPVNLNHSVVLKQSAPEGYAFNKLSSLNTNPSYTLEDLGSRHIHIKVATDEAGTDVIWDSDLDALPQNTSGFDPSTPAQTLYFIVSLNYVQTSGGSTSPFLVGTSPVFKGLDFQAKVEAI